MKPIVYFTRDLTPEGVKKMYNVLKLNLKGKTAVKLHSGEEGNQNFLGPEWMKPIVEELHVPFAHGERNEKATWWQDGL